MVGIQAGFYDVRQQLRDMPVHQQRGRSSIRYRLYLSDLRQEADEIGPRAVEAKLAGDRVLEKIPPLLVLVMKFAYETRKTIMATRFLLAMLDSNTAIYCLHYTAYVR